MTELSPKERAAMQWRLDWLEQCLEQNDFVEAFSSYDGGFGLRAR